MSRINLKRRNILISGLDAELRDPIYQLFLPLTSISVKNGLIMLRRCKIGEWMAKQLHHFSSIVFSLYFHWHFLCHACKKTSRWNPFANNDHSETGLSYKSECDEERTWSKSENQLESVTHSLYLWELRWVSAEHLGLQNFMTNEMLHFTDC